MLLALTAVVAVVLLVDAAMQSGIENTLLLAPWPLLVVWTVYVVGVASDVRADHAGARVQNLLRRTSIPWARVQRMAMRWQLEFTLDDGIVINCFGGPARSRPRRLGPGRTKEDVVDETEDGIAKLHRLRAEAAETSDAVAADAGIVRTWDWPAILAFGVIAAWAAVAVALTR